MEVCCIEVPLWQVFKYRECILSPLSFFMDFFYVFSQFKPFKVITKKSLFQFLMLFLEIMRSHKK